MNFVDRVIAECVEARIEAQRHGVANYGIDVTCTNEHGAAMHQVFGAVDDSGSIMIPWPENVSPTLPEVSIEEVEDMGLNLKLLPVEGDWEKEGYSQTVLTLEQCPDLFCFLSDFSRQFEIPVPAMFNTYLSGLNVRDEHYGNTQKTGTGDPLRMGPVRELLRFSDHPGVYEEPQNRAVWAYLRELPEESMIALYWD